MGAYRSKPITDKVSSDESGKYVKCGASSMQGWRVTQEDSHNCIMEYDEATSLFAVYDGHGGHEVAQYCSENLPQYLKECVSYKKGEYSTALKEAFLGFDATLVETKVVKVLKQIVKSADDENEGSENQNSGSEDEENILNLYEEAQMPLEEVMAKYQSDGLDPMFKKLKGQTPLSPFLMAKQSSKLKTSEEACSSKAGSSSSSSDVVPLEESSCESGEKEEERSSNGSREEVTELNDGSGDKSREQQKASEELEKKSSDNNHKSNGEKTSAQSRESTEKKSSEKSREVISEKLPEKSEDLVSEKKLDSKEELSVTKADETEESSIEKKSEEILKFNKEKTSEEKTECRDEKKSKDDHVEDKDKKSVHEKEHKEKVHDLEKNTSGKKVEMNGDVDPNDLAGKTKKEPHENGDVADEETEDEEEEEKDAVKSRKGKGKAILKKTDRPKRTSARQRNMALLFRSWLSAQDADSESDDEGDESFQGAEDSSSNEDDDKEAEAGAEGEEEEEEEADDEEDEDGEEEEEEEEEDYDDDEPSKLAKGPGVESGCTAVIAVLHGRDLYVANAGDSRCIVSRSGEALDMSLDHKPEDVVEFERIAAAGGFVSGDGRVNGGLNLSRAIGDHAYKKTENLPAEEQMITALPDVRTLSLDPEQDEFMVLACDGIWNSMTSQEVISFVRTRLQSGDKKLSTICEELFDFCLAPDTASDGTGCDNMTAVIVQFLPVMKEASSSNLPNTSIHTTTKRPASPTENSDSIAKRFKTDVV